jgi:hypothetical protein
VAPRIAIPISIIMAVLILGLTRYYSITTDENPPSTQMTKPKAIDDSGNVKYIEDNDNYRQYPFIILFVGLYVVLLVICALTSEPNLHIFISWSQIEPIGIIQLGVAIMLSFFIPGYAVTHIIIKGCKINPILKILLAYLFSMIITGGIGYVLSLFLDIPASDSKNLVLGAYLTILVIFIISYYVNRVNVKNTQQNSYQISYRFISYLNNRLWMYAKSNGSQIVVFGSLFMLLIVSTYYLFGGITVGDQWFHQGRALLFMSGSIREAALSNTDSLYPPFQSAVVATLTTLSGLPLVNTYGSIAFLNIIYVFAFYYFISKWIPKNMQRAKILASTFLAISSGFGWIYLLGLTVTTNPVDSQGSVLDTITSTEPFDVFQPTNFLLASHPDFSTGLIYIVLPAGFVLLGLFRDNFNKFILFSIVTSISVLGILSHDEFYLFIIVASILPLLFKIKQGNYIYFGLLLSLLIVYVIDIINPEKYYTSTYVLFESPLLVINVMFTGIMWTLYFTRKKLHRILSQIMTIPNKFSSNLPKNKSRNDARLRFLIGVIVVSLVAYVYGLSFIVLAHLSTNDIIHQTAGYGTPYNIPWYLYSMKFGIIGLLGLVSVLSYLFKKFEREVFVFGIIIVIALLAGPYYDEHRLGKYIMVGMAGFAALFVYKILNSLAANNKRGLNRIVIGIIITTASLSSILYIGYNSLILQTQDFVHTLSRRNFPSVSEMPLFQTVYDKIDVGSKRYNIVSYPNEYGDLEKGLMTKLQAFSGLPDTIIYQKPLTLNVSSLDAFYHLLDDSGTKFIIVPRNSINKTQGITEPVHFAINHFQHTYEDGKYIVLEVPELKPPSSSSETDTALVYNNNRNDNTSLSDVTGSKLLQYTNSTFNFGGETNFVIIQKGNKSEQAILSDYDSNKGLTLWSRDLDSKSGINVVEVEFRIIKENSKKNNDVGLKWKEADNEYYVSLSKDGLELSKKAGNTNFYNKVLYRNLEIEKEDLVGYSLRLETTQNSTNIFLDNNLRIQVPRVDSGNGPPSISKVGISASNSIVEFGAIKTGNISTQDYNGVGTKYDDYYYPLSILALSKSKYDIFMDKDLSAFSKKNIVLASDPLDWDDNTFNRYLEYVGKGGTLVVMNSHDFKGKFGRLFSIQPSDNGTTTFTSAVGKNNDSISVSGLVKKVSLYDSPDVEIISAYRDKENRMVAPLAIEKHFTNGGKIVLVNNEAYFKALSKSPEQYFLSLSNITRLLGLDTGKAVASESTSAQAKRFLGDLKSSGNITIKSSSLLLDDSNDAVGNNSHDIHADSILISNKSNNLNHTFNNVTIKDLRLVGQHDITIKSNGTLSLPHMGSQHEYFKILVPAKSTMTVSLPNRLSYVEIDILNGSSFRTIKVNSDSKISFYNISTASSSKSIPIILKSPEVEVDGHIGFKQSNFDPYFTNNDIPLDYEGGLKTKLSFVDDYKESNLNQTIIKYITYLQSITTATDVGVGQDGIILNLPGDISPYAKSHGIPIPLREVLFSGSNVMLLISTAVVSLVGSWLMWPKLKPRMTEEQT